MAIKWKNIIKKGIVPARYLLFVIWICAMAVFVVLVKNNNLMDYENFRDTITKTAYTKSHAFEELIQDALCGMKKVYKKDLRKQLRKEIQSYLENGMEEPLYNEKAEKYQLELEFVYSYELDGKTKHYKDGFVVWMDAWRNLDFVNEEDYYLEEPSLEQSVIYSDQLLEEILGLEVPIQYTAYSAKFFDSFSNISQLRIWDLEQSEEKKGLWIGNKNGKITVVNHTKYSVGNLDKIQEIVSQEENEYLFGFNQTALNTLVEKWEKQCDQVRFSLGIFLLVFILWLEIVAVMCVKKIERLHAKPIINWIGNAISVCGKFIKRNVFGTITGEFWYEKGFEKAEQIRTTITAVLLLFGGVWILGGIYSCAYKIRWYVWELQLYFGIIFAVETLVLTLYGVGTFLVTKKYENVQNGICKISKGDFQVHSVSEEETPFGQELTLLGDIGSGFEKNLETRIRAERTKMELVTNVSHDLKTPLTSIISYIDLLQRMEELPMEAREYVGILEQKSARLKVIVADVFELAKTASGEIKLDIERLNVNRLLLQTIASLQDRIDLSGLQMKTRLSEEKIYIVSDGQRMYRVLQNLIDNALKYSLAGTRVYILEEVLGDVVGITIKNTANYEMDFTAEDVTERFFCGDKSRNTEGHGLGLSIAQGFTVACGGEFLVNIDGDQFNVTLRFPISKEPDSLVDLEEEHAGLH